jgi:hypothetical protein
MKHVIRVTIAAILAIAVSFGLATFGAHGTNGLIAVWIGYPGGIANQKLNPGRLSYGLITAANWLVYFTLLEALLTLKRRFSN